MVVSFQVLALLAAIPPEIGGLPTWALNGLSIGGLVAMIVTGLMTSRLWTKRQVDELVRQHDREMTDVKARYETHINQTAELNKARIDDALTREKEWKDVAQRWEATANMLAQGLEPLQDQGETLLRIVTAWQSETRRRELGS